jgi:hypothetical protein
MTRDVWLASTDPQGMLTFLRENRRLNERKARLFACACVRRVWHLIKSESARLAVEEAERYADGVATRGQLWELSDGALNAVWDALPGKTHREITPSEWAAQAAVWSANQQGPEYFFREAARLAVIAASTDGDMAPAEVTDRGCREVAGQAALLRDIFADPFAPPPSVAPSVLAWNAGMVVELSRSIYEQRSFQDLPVLADALEAAGSTDAGLLRHFRVGGVHAKGCDWLDEILGKK